MPLGLGANFKPAAVEPSVNGSVPISHFEAFESKNASVTSSFSHARSSAMNHNHSVPSASRLAAPSGMFVSAALIALTFACSDPGASGDGDPGDGPQLAREASESAAALHIFVPGTDEYSQLDVPPLPVVAGDASTYQRFVALTDEERELMNVAGDEWGLPVGEEDGESTGASTGSRDAAPRSRTMDTVVSIDGVTTAGIPGEMGQAILLKVLSLDCGFQTNPLLEGKFQEDVLVPGKVEDDRYFVFQPPETCDALVAYQEAALCVAERLTAVADAVDTVRFVRTSI